MSGLQVRKAFSAACLISDMHDMQVKLLFWAEEPLSMVRFFLGGGQEQKNAR